MKEMTCENAPQDFGMFFVVQRPLGTRLTIAGMKSEIIDETGGSPVNLEIDGQLDDDETEEIAELFEPRFAHTFKESGLSSLTLEVLLFEPDARREYVSAQPDIVLERARGENHNGEVFFSAPGCENLAKTLLQLSVTYRHIAPLQMIQAWVTEDEKTLEKWRKRLNLGAFHPYGVHHYRPDIVLERDQCVDEGQWEDVWAI